MWPELTLDHIRLVDDTLRSGRITDGPMVERFEEAFAAKVGARRAVMCSSGSAAIHVALLAAGVAGDIGLPAFTFSGTAFGPAHLGLHPVWLDADPWTANVVDHRTVEGCTPVVVVHLHGLPAPVPDGTVVEDCAQSFGSIASLSTGEWTGRRGTAACWSLNATKVMWAGEGGVVTCDDDNLADEVRALIRFGGSRVVTLDSRGHNWKPDEVRAALGIASLMHVDRWVAAGRDNADALTRALDPVTEWEAWPTTGIRPVIPADGTSGNGHKYRIVLPDGIDPDAFTAALREGGVPACRWQTHPLPDHPGFPDAPDGSVDTARRLLDHSVVLGTEDMPLQVANPGVVSSWAARVQELLANRPSGRTP